MIDEYDAYLQRFKAELLDRTSKDGQIDLDDLPAGSALEMCFILVSHV